MAERGLLARAIQAKLLLFSVESSVENAESAIGECKERRGFSKGRGEALRGYCSDRMVGCEGLAGYRRRAGK